MRSLLKESPDLLSGQSIGGCVDGFADAAGSVIASGCAEQEGGP